MAKIDDDIIVRIDPSICRADERRLPAWGWKRQRLQTPSRVEELRLASSMWTNAPNDRTRCVTPIRIGIIVAKHI